MAGPIAGRVARASDRAVGARVVPCSSTIIGTNRPLADAAAVILGPVMYSAGRRAAPGGVEGARALALPLQAVAGPRTMAGPRAKPRPNGAKKRRLKIMLRRRPDRARRGEASRRGSSRVRSGPARPRTATA